MKDQSPCVCTITNRDKITERSQALEFAERAKTSENFTASIIIEDETVLEVYEKKRDEEK